MVSVPTRGLLIPNLARPEDIEKYIKVSVPTRGLLIPNYGTNYSGQLRHVSVPTRGLLIPNAAFATPVFIRG